ncbi:restriction endonuclease-like protein [Bacillus sp. Bva_UNVM-123]|uniref:DUF2357 domain-containing protein n=1 Tax=Bacillus sp. Bva_UNVM-123 TaxID=2829798 RepID=UPI00391F5AA2
MASLPSGSREDVELVLIETEQCSLVIKGKPYHERYEGLKQYRTMDFNDLMNFDVRGEGILEQKVLDINEGKLVTSDKVRPTFFENGIYQVIVVPKVEGEFSFYHEHPILRQAVTPVKIGKQKLLMGNLQFQNEVGYTTFEIRLEKQTMLEVTLEIFPTKLDYKEDYKKLLEEVNDEIYNLAFHFIRKTYLGASLKSRANPSKAEFYRLISKHFLQFTQALQRIEQQPHRQLQTTHEKVRGDQLSKLDYTSRSYLRKRANLFVEVKNGIKLGQKQVMPIEGLRIKKEVTSDTLENRYVKWMIERLIYKLTDLLDSIQKESKRWKDSSDSEIIGQIENMKKQLKGKLKQTFWKSIGPLKRSVMSLVLQMAPGYRDAFQIYLTVSKGLMLQGKFYQMSVKDVATLYEYWTFLKLGQILGRKYKMISQDVIKVNREGLYVNLEANQSASRIFQHPVTDEKIILAYQKRERNLPTVNQIPDTVLSIEKKGRNYAFNYIFDAKYRIDYAQNGGYYHSRYDKPGPMEDDINTMHRYRDSIVAANQGPYERTAFGAYVLFPWTYEKLYQEHHFYKSINEVNIGGLPFLPNATTMVERFVERLIEKSPEEIQREGILPRGTLEEWQSSLDEKVLVGLVSSEEEYVRFIQEGYYEISNSSLKKGWQEAKYVALYVKCGVLKENGVIVYGKIKDLMWINEIVQFEVEHWKNLQTVIKPVNYGIASYIMTTITNLNEAKELPELFLKSKDELTLWKMLRRVSDRIKLDLDTVNIDEAVMIKEYHIKGIKINLEQSRQEMVFTNGKEQSIIPVEKLTTNPTFVFKMLVEMLTK